MSALQSGHCLISTRYPTRTYKAAVLTARQLSVIVLLQWDNVYIVHTLSAPILGPALCPLQQEASTFQPSDVSVCMGRNIFSRR